MFKNILLPIDLDDPEQSKLSVSWLNEYIAKDEKSIEAINILYVLPSYSLSWIASYFPQGFEKKQTDKALAKLKDWGKSNFKNNNKIKYIVAHGTAYEEVISFEKKLNIDLTIVQAHDPKKEDVLIGTTSARVMRHAKKSVMLLRR